ncbi:MAG: CGGC domain-containing protein [Fretibacterium sp.]|nr:CGGC domain-containing protein [Fretibacterium sp.]
MPRLAVVIQCDDVTKRCSGFLCMRDFYDRAGKFAGYPEDVRYMTLTCGGCCGSLLTAKLENLGSWLKKSGIEKENVAVHLASCVCMDNHHRQPCPFMNRIRALLERKGFLNVVLGSHVSQKAEAKRQAGIYRVTA